VLGRDGRPLDVIELANQRVPCIVGLYPSEDLAPQPLEVTVSLHLDTEPAAAESGLRHSIDYARVAGELRFLLENARFRTLESAAGALARWLLAPASQDVPHAPIDAVDVRLTKPNALGGGGAGVPTIHVRRLARDQRFIVEDKPWGQVDIIHEHRGVGSTPQDHGGLGVYRLRIAPGHAIPTHLHRVMHEAELALGPGLQLQRVPVRAGTAVQWPHGFAHRWDNPGDTEQSILCIDRPGFIHADETEQPEPAGGLAAVAGRLYYPLEGTEILTENRTLRGTP
jgi:dihydroneopterin aldolase